jgi:hypothetical protein
VDFRRVILQDADLGGILEILLQELGLDPIAHSGHVGIGGLGLGFLCGNRGDAAAEELLLPMAAALKQALSGNGSKDA